MALTKTYLPSHHRKLHLLYFTKVKTKVYLSPAKSLTSESKVWHAVIKTKRIDNGKSADEESDALYGHGGKRSMRMNAALVSGDAMFNDIISSYTSAVPIKFMHSFLELEATSD